jgi:hypothetical protein
MQLPTREMAKWHPGPDVQPRLPAASALRKLGIAMAGFSVLLLGLVLLVVPVPGTSVAVLPLGLTILAREFPWARRLLDRWTATVRHTWAGVRRLLGWRPAAAASAS